MKVEIGKRWRPEKWQETKINSEREKEEGRKKAVLIGMEEEVMKERVEVGRENKGGGNQDCENGGNKEWG